MVHRVREIGITAGVIEVLREHRSDCRLIHAGRLHDSRPLVRREDAERFSEEVRGDEPKLASYLRIEERELEVGAD